MSSDSDEDAYSVCSDTSSDENNEEASALNSAGYDDSVELQKSPDRKMSTYEILREQRIAWRRPRRDREKHECLLCR
jgi:hypothetical protein